FLEELRLERVGVFRYSQEEDTPAGAMDEQVPEQVKESRRRRAMSLQARISRARNAALVGETLPVLVCGQHANGRWFGRTQGQAADIDGVTHVGPVEERDVGSIARVRITRATAYDLEGVLIAKSAAHPHRQ